MVTLAENCAAAVDDQRRIQHLRGHSCEAADRAGASPPRLGCGSALGCPAVGVYQTESRLTGEVILRIHPEVRGVGGKHERQMVRQRSVSFDVGLLDPGKQE